MQKVGYGIDQKLQGQIERTQTFRPEDYLVEIHNVWNGVDHAQHKEISRTRFYRYLNEQKLVLNADQSKAEEVLKQLMYTWGRVPEKPDSRPADATGTQMHKPRKGAYKLALDALETISKMTFEQMFEKVVMHAGVRNAIQLLGQFSTPLEFTKHYSTDQMTATFKVLQYQREFLYQTFENPPSGGDQGAELYRRGTREQLANPYAVELLLNPRARKKQNKGVLQTATKDAVEKMSEYAIKTGLFNHGMVRTEIDYKIRELALRKKAEAQARRRQAQLRALSLGFDITKLDFFKAEVLRRFADEPTSQFTLSQSSEPGPESVQKRFEELLSEEDKD
jgi:hypothetical protein